MVCFDWLLADGAWSLVMVLDARVVFKSGVTQIFEANQNVVIWLVK